MTVAEAQAAANSRAASDQSADQQTAYYQNQAALGQGAYPGSPQYGGGGIMPKRDGGLERYLSHHLGNTHWSSTTEEAAKAVDGPYRGMYKNAAIEKMNDEYRNMSPEDRAVYERQAFNQDQRSPAEMKSQGFQYQDQTDAYGDKSPLNNPVSTNPTYGSPSAQSFARSAGGMDDDNASNKGAKHNSTSDLLGDTPQLPGSTPANVVPHPEMAVAPVGGVAAESPGVQKQSNPVGAPVVSNGGFTSTNPDFRAATGMQNGQPVMGDPNDTAKYGPRYTGSGSLNAVDTAARNEMATKAFNDSQAGVKAPGTAQAPGYAAPASPTTPMPNPNQPIGTTQVASTPLPQPSVASTPNTASVPNPAASPVPMPAPSIAQQVGQGLGMVPGRVAQGVTGAAQAVGTEIGREGSEVGQTAEQIAEEARRKAAAGIGAARDAVGSTIGAPIANATANVVGAASDFSKGLSQGLKAPTYNQAPIASSIPTPAPAYAAVK